MPLEAEPESDPEPATGALRSRDTVVDLHLDDIVASITGGREEYDLAPIFSTPLRDTGTISYRHEPFRDLGDSRLLDAVRSFAEKMRTMRDLLGRASKARYQYEMERWFLDASLAYDEAVTVLAEDLARADLQSRAFVELREFLAGYVASEAFGSLRSDARQVRSALDGITYRLHLTGSRIAVSRYEAEPDYGAEVLQTFEKFKQGSVQDYRFAFSSSPDLNHVEVAILERVARLHPEVFAALDEFATRHREYLDPTVARFDREVQFYVAYLEHVERFRPAGLAFCLPEITDRNKEIHGSAVFDLALAQTLAKGGAPVVTNDFYLRDPERILVVSGPNQGGKTTFARTIGQLHHLASIGGPVPGTAARLFLVDGIFTHFEREEDLDNQSGKLEDDLRRIHRILERATPESLVVMNESFSSTTLNDALFLNGEVMRVIIERDLLCVTVTFLDELASLGVTTVSTVDPDDPATRTFKVVRRPADGLAYALAIAEKHGLTYQGVKARVSP